jgi:hypothetical protein
MFGTTSHLSPLESQKQLLIAESELNRVQLFQEWQTMAEGVRGLAGRAKTIGTWASAVALLLAGITAWRRGAPATVAAKSSWFQKMLRLARVASTIWFAIRARAHKEQLQ